MFLFYATTIGMYTRYCTPWSKNEMSLFETINHPTIRFISSYKLSPTLTGRLLGEDLHGLRSRDLDHKDKQNYDAVEHIFKGICII
jgi:hypothetical protein